MGSRGVVPPWRAKAGAVPPPAPVVKPQRPQTKRVIFPVTRKGGVGQTFFLVHLSDWLAHERVRQVALDPDWVNGSLSRFLPEARFWDPGSPESAEELMLVTREADVVLVDGLGPLQAYALDWLNDHNFLQEESEAPISITAVVIVEEDKDTVFQAGEAAKFLGDQVDWLVVRNLKTCSTTEIYNQSNARQELIRLGAAEIQVERLPWNLLLMLQRSSRTIGNLITDEELSILERQRLRSYEARFFAQLETIRSVLLPRMSPQIPSLPEVPEAIPRARPRIAPEQV